MDFTCLDFLASPKLCEEGGATYLKHTAADLVEVG